MFLYFSLNSDFFFLLIKKLQKFLIQFWRFWCVVRCDGFFLFLLCFVCFFVLKVMVILSSIFNSIIFLLSFFFNQSIKKKKIFFLTALVYISMTTIFLVFWWILWCAVAAEFVASQNGFVLIIFLPRFFMIFGAGDRALKISKEKLLKIFIWRLHSRVLGFFNNSH